MFIMKKNNAAAYIGVAAVWVGGHMHQDIGEYADGILRVSTLNDSMHNSSGSL